MCNTYVEKVPKVEGFQFDGANGQEIIDWLGGADYGVISGETLILSLQGKDPRSEKVTVNRGQFVVKSNKAGTSVVNEGEFIAAFANEDGSDIVSLPPPPPEPPVADEELVYQPGFRPLTEEEKKASAKAHEVKAKEKEEPHRVFSRR